MPYPFPRIFHRNPAVYVLGYAPAAAVAHALYRVQCMLIMTDHGMSMTVTCQCLISIPKKALVQHAPTTYDMSTIVEHTKISSASATRKCRRPQITPTRNLHCRSHSRPCAPPMFHRHHRGLPRRMAMTLYAIAKAASAAVLGHVPAARV